MRDVIMWSLPKELSFCCILSKSIKNWACIYQYSWLLPLFCVLFRTSLPSSQSQTHPPRSLWVMFMMQPVFCIHKGNITIVINCRLGRENQGTFVTRSSTIVFATTIWWWYLSFSKSNTMTWCTFSAFWRFLSHSCNLLSGVHPLKINH